MLTNNNINPDTRKIILTVIKANDLRINKRFWVSKVKPNPFAIITVDGGQTNTTKTKKNTTNPEWNEKFTVNVSNSSVVSIKIFDRKKNLKKTENQEFLGEVTLKLSRIIELNSYTSGKILKCQLKPSSDSTTSSVSGNLVIEINFKPIERPASIPAEIEEPIPVQDVQDDSDFDFSFLKMENNNKNMLYSPLSIKYGLKMLQEGASGNTYDEINNVIGKSPLSKYANYDKNIALANGIFIRDNFFDDISKKYLDTLKEKYDAEIKKDEFKDADNANQWIEDKTLRIIKNMLNDEMVKYSDMLLINALVINLEWTDPFYFTETEGKPFYMDNGQEMIATTMRKKFMEDYFSFYTSRNITVITMNFKVYNGAQMEFMAIMPHKKEKNTLSKFVENVSKSYINEIDRNLKQRYEITVEIPRFKFNYDLKLKEDLKN